jgi:hypothetical protein
MPEEGDSLMTSIFTRPLRFAAVAALPLLLAAKPLSAPMAGGTTYEFRVRAKTAQGGDKESVMMRGQGTFAGSDGRIDILETASPQGSEVFGSKGSYFLVREGGKKMIIVDPAKKQYMEWDMASMLAGMGKLVNAMGGLMKFEMSDVKIESRNLGGGEKLEGYPTVHYQMIENYTMNVKIFGRSSKSRTETTTDYWFAPSLHGLANPFVANGRAMAESFDMFNNPDYKAQMAAAQARIQFSVPLKTVVRTVSTDDKGKQKVTVVTSEMVNFRNVDVPKSTFAIPDGYKLIEMPKIDANVAAGDSAGPKGEVAMPDVNADSIANAAKDSAKEAAKNAAKDAAKNAAGKKLRGIFKR